MLASRQRAAVTCPWFANVSSEMNAFQCSLVLSCVENSSSADSLTLLLGILNSVLLKPRFLGTCHFPLVLSVSTKSSSHSYSPVGSWCCKSEIRRCISFTLDLSFLQGFYSFHLLQCINGGSTPCSLFSISIIHTSLLQACSKNFFSFLHFCLFCTFCFIFVCFFFLIMWVVEEEEKNVLYPLRFFWLSSNYIVIK